MCFSCIFHEIYNINLIKLACEKFNQVYISVGAAKWEEIIALKKNIPIEKVLFSPELSQRFFVI